jgi:class 3 adenylate cyclase
MPDLRDWLTQHGLEALAPALIDNDIDLDILPDLTEQDFERLGLSIGQRRRLAKAIASLSAATPAAPAPIPTPRAPEPSAAPREAERRQVTVMFCDLVGSTELSSRLDPEDMSKLIRRYQDACAGAIARFDGFLAKLMGDGVLAYFGFPQAHEDDAERAVRAALTIVGAMPQITTPDGRHLEARIGIATGLVVVGDIVGTGVAREQSIVGETPNLAARLQALAAPGTILVSHSTHRLIGRIFDVESAGEHPVKGFAQPVPAWRVLREAAIASRFAAARSATNVPFVGREHEIGLLLDRWRSAVAGDGQFVLLTGEAGIGKSRLVDALRERCAADPMALIGFQCSSHYVNTALHPMIRYLELAAGFAFDEAPSCKVEKLAGLLAGTTPGGIAAVPLLADAMSLPASERYVLPPDLSAAQRKTATINAFIDHVTRTAARTPVLFLLEDAHWIDPTTTELVTALIDAIATARILVIVTARPEFASPWSGRAHATQLTLSRLGRAQCAQMVATVAAAHAIPPAVLDEIVAKTDGVPLFVEELTKTILEAGMSGGRAVPATLQDSLMARLDRLGEAKEIAQIAAVIGRQFSKSLLAAIASQEPDALDRAMGRLVDSEIVFPQRQAIETAYSFKHGLMRDAAYDSLLRARRQSLHERIGKALEERFPTIVAEEPELLAYHFERAGLADKASRYHERAGDRAAAHSAYAEAVAHFQAALTEARKLPDRAPRALSLLLKLNPAMTILKGAQHPEVEAVAQSAYDMAREIGDGPGLFKATWNLWLGANMGGKRGAARGRAEELVSLGGRLGDEDLFLEAIHCRWSTALFGGDLAVAFQDSREGIRRYDPARHHELGEAFGGHDPGVCAYSVHAMMLTFAGEVERGQQVLSQAIALAEKLGHQHTLAHAFSVMTFIHHATGDRAATAHYARRLIDVAEKCNFPPQRALGRLFAGWAQAEGAALESSLARMEAEFPHVATYGPRMQSSATMLAEVRLRSGRVADALDLIERTVAAATDPDVGYYIPQLLQLHRECLARLGRDQDQSQAAAASQLARRYDEQMARLRAAVAR